MEWFVLLAPVPDGTVEFALHGGLAFGVGLVVAATLLALAARHVFGAEAAAPDLPHLRVIEGGKEPKRQAA